MSLDQVTPGKHVPDAFNVIIEIPMNADPVKYEVDKETGAIFVDRFMSTSMHYPTNYGYVPKTISGDGDPVDVLVVGRVPVMPGAVMRSRPVGVLVMEDEAGGDEKILAVPVDKLHPFYAGVDSWRSLPSILTEQIAHFFKHYKDLEKGKSVEIVRWADPEETGELIRQGIERADAAGKGWGQK